MDVTKSNFNQLKPEIEDAIEKCCFAAIDCEFTGLLLPEPLHPLDTVAQRYQKLRAGISEYLVVQFGLSLWTFHEDSQSYRVRTFNMFVFPDGKLQHKFFSQAGCLQFLVQHGFDLNRCVREGISFLHPQELEDQRQRLRSRQLAELSLILDRDQSFLEKVVDGSMTSEALHERQASPSVESVAGLDSAARSYVQSVSTAVKQWMSEEAADREALLLPACNEFVRITVYRHLEKEFFERKFQMEAVRADANEHRGLRHVKLSNSESSPIQRLLQKQQEERDSLEQRFGVSSVFSTLIRLQKPVVGHNSLRDVLHVIQQFIAPLPEDFGEFQAMCKEMFPVLFDTKHMSVTGTIKSLIRGTRLVELFNQIKSQHDKAFPMPTIQIEKGYGYDDTAREHEAGFDAWLTGYIFAAFAHHVAPHRKGVSRRLQLLHESFRPFRNKMPFGPSLDISTVELDQSPAAVNRGEVYIIEWKEPDDHAHARYLLSVVGGAKRCGYGDQLLAFVPSNSESCAKVLRAQDNSATACRLYKWNSSKQNRRRKAKSKSPPNTLPATATSNTATGAASAAAPPSQVALKVKSPQNSHSRTHLLGSGADLPKKPKLEGILGSAEPSSPVQQSGPFPEASW